MDEAEPAVRDIGNAAHKRVGMCVLVGHAQGRQEGDAKQRESRAAATALGTQTLRQQLQSRADGEELAQRQVHGEHGVGGGGDDEPASECRSISLYEPSEWGVMVSFVGCVFA